MISTKIFIYLVCFALYATAEQIESKDVTTMQQEVSTSSTYKTIAVLTALATVAAGVVAIVAWILPLIAYKFCYLFGSCEYSLGAYVDQFLIGGRQNTMQKRSLEYVGPLLQTLANAYEMYESGDTKKNFKKDNSYRR